MRIILLFKYFRVQGWKQRYQVSRVLAKTQQVVSRQTCSKSIGIQTDEINNCFSVADINNSVIETNNKMLCNNMNLNSMKCNYEITNHGVRSEIEKSQCNSIVVGTHDNSRNMSENMNLNNNVDLCDSCDNEFNILSILFQDNDCADYQTRFLRVNNNTNNSKGDNNSVSLINKSMNEKSDFETFEKVICESDLSEFLVFRRILSSSVKTTLTP